ncbi:MAG: hypothetical protein ABI647_00880 [Gemmatimonadota bacterium]
MRARFLAVLLVLTGVGTARAQTAADTADVILGVARNLEREGRPDAARELFRYLHTRYRTTPAARAADSLPTVAAIGSGRTGFVTFNTLYGGFLGVAIPAAFNSNDGATFGIGLLLGAPAGFFASRSFARAHLRTAGQAGIASFGTAWGTWMGFGLQQILNIGDKKICDQQFCYTQTSDGAPWAAMVIGGLGGLGLGWALASAKETIPGTATLISNSAFWGTWFGLALGRIADLEGDALFTSTLAVGNAALLAAIPAARAWRPTPSRVRLITAAGLAGGLAGLGIDLIANTDDDRVAIGIPAATSALGLLIAALATTNRRDLEGPDGGEVEANAVFQWRNGPRVKLAIPEPTAFQIVDRDGKLRTAPGARLRIFDARF